MLEFLRKIELIAIACLKCDFIHAQVCVMKEIFCLFNFALDAVFPGSHSEFFRKRYFRCVWPGDRKLLDEWGKLPPLARVGSAEMERSLSSGTEKALGLDGRRIGKIPARCSGERLRFTVKTNRYAEDAVFCCHIFPVNLRKRKGGQRRLNMMRCSRRTVLPLPDWTTERK